MKAFYIPVGLLALILGFSLWTGRYVELRTQHWTALLEETGADTVVIELVERNLDDLVRRAPVFPRAGAWCVTGHAAPGRGRRRG